MVTVNVIAKTSTFQKEEKEIKKRYQYWEDKDWEKNLMKRLVVDIVADESNDLDYVKKIEISYIASQ